MTEYTFRTRPYDHQRRYLQQSTPRTAFALFADYGTGKSKMDIDETAILHMQGQADTWLIVTAKGNYANWPQEIEKHMPLLVRRHIHLWTLSNSARSRIDFRDLCKYDGLAILVVNVEALAASSRTRTAVRQFMGRSKKRKITMDESTLIKNHEAKRTKEMVVLAGVAEYRRILSGNPTPNTPMDLWGQFLFLGQGSGRLLGHNSFYSFRARYAVLQDQHVGNGRTVKVPVAWRNLEELNRVVSAVSFRARKEDCLDLPPKIYAPPRMVEMTDEQRFHYENVKRRAWTELEGGGTISAVQVMAQMTKMQQICCGRVIDDDGVVREIPTNRLQELSDVLEESGKQTIIWCAYRANVAAVVEMLRKNYGVGSTVEYHGGVGTEDRAAAIRRFQSGDAHYFVGTPHTGGRGITLTASKSVVYFSNTHDLEHRTNSEDRAHRIGQTASVVYTDLMIPGTVDEKIIHALRKKIDISTTILGDGWKEWLV